MRIVLSILLFSTFLAAAAGESQIPNLRQIVSAPEIVSTKLLSQISHVLKSADFRDFPSDTPPKVRNDLRSNGVGLQSFRGSIAGSFVWSIVWRTVRSYCSPRQNNLICQNIASLYLQIQELKDLDSSSLSFPSTHGWLESIVSELWPEARAASKCGFDPSNKYFTTQSGNKIDFMFGAHADPFLVDNVVSTVSDEKSSSSDKIKAVDRILTAQKALVDDLPKLRARLEAAKRGGAQWLGVEEGPMVGTTESLKSVEDQVSGLRSSMVKGGVDAKKADKVVALFCLAYGGICDSKQPKLGLGVVGLDDEDAKEKGEGLLRKNKAIVNEGVLQKIPHETITRLDELRKVAGQAKTISMTDVDTVLSAISDESAKKQVGQYLANLQAYSKQQAQRNQYAADSIRGLPGNGVVILGGNHEEGILKALSASCSATTTTKSTTIKR